MQLPKEFSSVESVFWAVFNIIGVIILFVVYTYIDKLERIQCKCSEHPTRNFIKGYIIFAIVFLLVNAVLPPTKMTGMFGEIYGFIYAIVMILFSVATFVFYIYAVRYARYLMIEKCKCSEDTRREVMYVWSILMLVLYSIIVLIPLIVVLAQGGVALVVTSGRDAIKKMTSLTMEATVNPVKSLRRVPGSLKDSFKQVKKSFKK